MSEIEERHRQQLRDLEEAMKSTWEEKSRVSEAHEAERRRLESEQQEAADKLSRQMVEKWLVLEDKRDIDLTISHVKESSKTSFPEFLPYINNWQGKLKELLKLETELIELDTVVAVYKSSLMKDEDVVVRSISSEDGVIAIVMNVLLITYFK